MVVVGVVVVVVGVVVVVVCILNDGVTNVTVGWVDE